MADGVGTDNASFWDRRYRELPQLGSGPGSRGYATFVKRRLVADVLARYPVQTVLDVGCGDLCFLDDALFAGKRYVGVDVSTVAVERGAQRFPGFRFVRRDVAREPLGERADLVISFDVLIHQLTRDAFDAALAHTLDAIDVAGLVSYSTPPRPDGSAPHHLPAELDAEELAHERELERVLSETKGRRVGMGTAFYGPFETLVAELRPGMKVAPVGVYRANTAYLVLPG